jgi:hypothetical protein
MVYTIVSNDLRNITWVVHGVTADVPHPVVNSLMILRIPFPHPPLALNSDCTRHPFTWGYVNNEFYKVWGSSLWPSWECVLLMFQEKLKCDMLQAEVSLHTHKKLVPGASEIRWLGIHAPDRGVSAS